MADGITIGQAASFAGVTIKTIRHYQQRGLKRWSQARDWAADDPRVDELATAWADHLIANPSLAPVRPGLRVRKDRRTRENCSATTGKTAGPPGPG